VKLRLLSGQIVEGTFVRQTPAPDGHVWIEIDAGATVKLYDQYDLAAPPRIEKINTAFRSDTVKMEQMKTRPADFREGTAYCPDETHWYTAGKVEHGVHPVDMRGGRTTNVQRAEDGSWDVFDEELDVIVTAK
jgi:hypothetical protein